MTSGTKRALIVVAASLTLVIVGWTVLIGSVLAWGGVATVRFLEQGGPRVTVPIPMAMVEAAAASSSVLRETGHVAVDMDLGEWEPFVREILEAIDECPDMVLVEVEDGRDTVRVEKSGGDLVIRVTDRDADFRISVPTRSVRRTVSRLMS